MYARPRTPVAPAGTLGLVSGAFAASSQEVTRTPSTSIVPQCAVIADTSVGVLLARLRRRRTSTSPPAEEPCSCRVAPLLSTRSARSSQTWPVVSTSSGAAGQAALMLLGVQACAV